MSIGSKPVNPANIYTVDIESSHLYFSHYFSAKFDKDGRFILPDIEEVATSYKPTIPLQFGIHKEGGAIKHIDLSDAHTIFMPNETVSSQASFVSRDGSKRINAIVGKTKYHTKEDLFEYLSSKGSKLSDRYLNYYMDNIAWHYLGKDNATTVTTKTESGKILNESKFSFEKFTLNLTPKKIKEMVESQNVSYQSMNFNKFIESKEADSLADLVSNIIKKGSLSSPSEIRAWNAPFDINFIRSILYNNGNQQLALAFDDAVKSGKIAINSVERDWQLIAYNLIKDDPQAAAKITIGYSPSAARETGRVGQLVKTFEEFQHSTVSWAQDTVSEHMKWYSKIANLGEQTHLAGPDVKLTGLLSEAFNRIKQEAMEKAVQAGHTFGTFESLALSEKGPSIITQAVDAIIKAETHGQLGTSASKLREEIVNKAVRTSKWYDKNFPSYIASKINKEQSSKWTTKYGKKYAGPLIATGALLALTYATLGKETEIDEFTGKIRKSAKTDGKESWGSHRYIDREAHYKTHILKTGAMGIVVPASVLYATGLQASMRDPNWFKGISKSGTLGIAENFLRTSYYGAQRIESLFPITRLIGITSISDYLFGTKRTPADGVKSAGFMIARTPKNKDVAEIQRLGIEFDQLLEKTKISNPDKFAQLREVLKPQKLSKELDSRLVRIKSIKGGGTRVYWDDSFKGAQEAITRSMDLDLNVDIVSFRKTDPKLIRLSERQKFRAEREINNLTKAHILNSSIYEYGREYLSQSGLGQKEYSKFIKGYKMPTGVAGNEILSKIWGASKLAQFHLDIGAKGIGEGKDIFTPAITRKLSDTKRMVKVRSLSKDPFSQESLSLMYNNAKHIIRQTVLPVYGMNNFLESPFETMGFGEWANEFFGVRAGKMAESESVLKNITGKALSFIHRPGLGLRIDAMKYGLPQYAAEFGIKRVLPAYLGIQAFSWLDKGLGALTGSPTGRGPLTMLPLKAWEGLTLAYSKVSDILGFTSVAKKQEEVAPGSTGIGFFAPAMTAYTAYRTGKFLHEKGPEPVRKGITSLLEFAKKSPLIADAIKGERYAGALAKTPIQKYMTWAFKNPLLGFLSASLVPMAPFIPGLLGSNKTYKERKAELKGEKEVAIRKYRGWLLSSSAYTGGKAIQFRRHALNLIENNWQDQGVIYPNAFKHFLNSATFGLADRYQLERYHAKDQPTYTSAPYGANVPFIGNIIASTVGRVIKPEVQYHEMHERGAITGIGATEGAGLTGSLGGDLATGSIVDNGDVDIESPHSLRAHTINMHAQFAEWAGLRGFMGVATMQYLTGKQSPDEFTPYAQNATQLYNPANIMWGYQAGDVSIVGGEFLRRIFQRPQKTWEVNDIPNEFYGVSWIPQQYDTKEKHRKDFTHGTTFDKMPLGWLYASKKGWDWLYGSESRGKDLEQLQAPIRAEILKQIAPSSHEFREAANNTLSMALNNQLDPKREQRFYNTLDEVRQLKEQTWSTAREYAYKVETQDIQDVVSDVDAQTGTFRLANDQEKIYRIAGISTAIEDIRARLLQQKTYESALKLDEDAKRIQLSIIETIQRNIKKGHEIDITVAQASQLPSNKGGFEAIIGGLNQDLIEQGAPYANTGTLSTYNMAQDRMGTGGKLISKYWEMLTSKDTFANKKLISKRDYFNQYLTTQVFNKEVKLWSHPLKHIISPFIASMAHNFGIDITPSFTIERREKQQYWDVIKYIKYKMLAVQAANSGDTNSAALFQAKYKATMVGADPTDDNRKDELLALPLNERAYFDFFSREPDPKKRARIYKSLPAPAKRIYSSIWAKQMAEGGDKDMQELVSQLKETGGYKLSEKEEELYQQEGGDKAAWARAHFIQEYAKEHKLPGISWSGWSPDVDIEDVEILALRGQGEQVQDYGYFDDKVRMAAFNGTAYAASIDMHTNFADIGSVSGTILPILASDDLITSATGMPTSSPFSSSTTDIETNSHHKALMGRGAYMGLIDDAFMTIRGFL